jgi:hypothetical protein
MPSYSSNDPEVQALTSVLTDHSLIDRDMRCTCGHRYKPGDSIRQHRAEVIIAAGWRRLDERRRA